MELLCENWACQTHREGYRSFPLKSRQFPCVSRAEAFVETCSSRHLDRGCSPHDTSGSPRTTAEFTCRTRPLPCRAGGATIEGAVVHDSIERGERVEAASGQPECPGQARLIDGCDAFHPEFLVSPCLACNAPEELDARAV